MAKNEIIRVVDQFTMEMKNSGYKHKETKEVVISGMIGWHVQECSKQP